VHHLRTLFCPLTADADVSLSELNGVSTGLGGSGARLIDGFLRARFKGHRGSLKACFGEL